MQVKLAGDALDVDGLAAFASLFVSDKGANRLADRDLDLDIKAGPVSAAGLTAETVDTALRLREGTLEIDRLSIGGLEGATISATGTVKDFPTSPSGKLDASVIAVDLAPLISVLAEALSGQSAGRGSCRKRAAAYPGLFADTQLDLVASAVAERRRHEQRRRKRQRQDGRQRSFAARCPANGNLANAARRAEVTLSSPRKTTTLNR